jgi:hypothetical protein
MPPPSSEPDKYTIDEMMDRLKGRNSSDKEPELVTRTDGSHAMKVRKRRRRTNQAVNSETKRNKRVHIIQITGFVVVVVLLGLAAGIGILYANSSNFRESLVSKLQAASGAEVKLNRFRMNPVAANTNGVSLKWPEGNALASLDLTSVAAKIAPASFTGKSFVGEEIVASKGMLVLRVPNTEESSRLVPKPSGRIPVKFARYSVPSLDIRFGEGKGWNSSLGKTEASLYPSTTAGQAEIRLRGGLLQISGWPEMVLDRSYIKVRNSEFQIKTMRLNIPEAPDNRSLKTGFIDFSGSIFPLKGDGSHRLAAKMERFRLPFLIGGDLGRFFFGNVDTKEIAASNFLSFAPESPEAASLEMTITNTVDSRIDISGFGFLSVLSIALDERWYEFPNFEDDVTLVVKRAGGKVEISDINLVNRGRMALRGTISNGDGGKIIGNLRVGIPETILAAAPDAKLKMMFGQLKDGYHWMDLEIGGTAAIPADNFKELYEKLSVPEEEEQPSQDSFEKLIEGQ